jgi:hypothetical protein
MGKAKPLSNEVLMVPNVMYMLHAWIGLGINGNSMEDIVRVVELKRNKARVFHSGLGFCSVGAEKDSHDQRKA